MQLTITQAAQRVGLSRATLYRHIQSGRLSVAVDENGRKWVDSSELDRVYGPDVHVRTSETLQERQEDVTGLHGQVADLRRQIAFLEGQIEIKDRQFQRLEERFDRLLEGPRTSQNLTFLQRLRDRFRR